MKKIRFTINFKKFVIKKEIVNKLPKRTVRIRINVNNKKSVQEN